MAVRRLGAWDADGAARTARAHASAEVRAARAATYQAAAKMKARAETIEAYDQMIDEGNAEGNAVVQAVIDTLLTQTKATERAVAALDLQPTTFDGSDSLDNPAAGTAQ